MFKSSLSSSSGSKVVGKRGGLRSLLERGPGVDSADDVLPLLLLVDNAWLEVVDDFLER